jgi:ubiquinone biosynthesis protein COQ4
VQSTSNRDQQRAAQSAARIDIKAALVAMRALSRNPDDTAQVFRIVESLSGPSAQKQFVRFSETEFGRRVLDAREELLPVLADRARLEAMPAESFAHAYLRFIDQEGITAGGLVDASTEGATGRWNADLIGAERDLFRHRMRDMHDLWHTLTGYRGDLIGEVSLLAFTLAQTRTQGIALIVAVGLARAPSSARRVILQGFARGLKATWLPGQDWVSLLPLPLDTVRSVLQIDAPPRYTPVYSREMGAASGARRDAA